MGLSRRNVLIGLGTVVAGGGAVLGTGAFTTVQAERTVTVETAGDGDAFLRLAPSGGPNGAYAEQTDGTIQINLDGTAVSNADGLNQNAITTINDIVEVTNNGTQTVTSLSFTIGVTDSSDDGAHEAALAITTDGAVINDGSNNGEDLLGPSGASAVTDDELGTGETVPFGVEVDLINHGVDGDFESAADVTLTIEADTA